MSVTRVGVIDFQHVMSNLIVLLSILTVSSVLFFCCVFDIRHLSS
jgi:hypothetical protein